MDLEQTLSDIRGRIERNALIHPMPSLRLSLEYISELRRRKVHDPDEQAHAVGYCLFLSEYINNPLTIGKVPVSRLWKELLFLDDPALHLKTYEAYLSAYTWRSKFGIREERPVAPIYNDVICNHRITLEKTYSEVEEENAFRVGVDGEHSFWISSFWVDENDSPERIVHDLIDHECVTALMSSAGMDEQEMRSIIDYLYMVKCWVCSKRIVEASPDSPMLIDEKWAEVYTYYGFKAEDDNCCEDDDSMYICLECMEKALGRHLTADDLLDRSMVEAMGLDAGCQDMKE